MGQEMCSGGSYAYMVVHLSHAFKFFLYLYHRNRGFSVMRTPRQHLVIILSRKMTTARKKDEFSTTGDPRIRRSLHSAFHLHSDTDVWFLISGLVFLFQNAISFSSVYFHSKMFILVWVHFCFHLLSHHQPLGECLLSSSFHLGATLSVLTTVVYSHHSRKYS